MLTRSERIERLRKAIIENEPVVSIERATLVTEAYQEFEADPILIKRAKVLDKLLRNMTIFINDGDLLVGNQGESLRCPPVYPENLVGWMDDEEEMARMEVRSVNPLKIPQQIRPQLKELAQYWKGKTLVDKVYAVFPDDILKARKSSLFSVSLEKNAVGHCVLDYEKLLQKGYHGLKEEIQNKLDKMDLTDPKELAKVEFLEAARIVCDAGIAFAERYAGLALELAEKEADQERKRELEKISAMCRKVPANPAGSFYEAVQSVYLAHIINVIETNAYSMSFGRFDQYMYPYYKKDIEEGKITVQEVQEIINCFWCKTNEIMHVDDSEMVYFHGGHPFGQHLTVGGMTRDGRDATNELSYMCLDAHEIVELYQPDFSVRLHKGSSYKFKERTAEVIRLGLGLPQIFNDEIVIESLMNDGLPLEEARDYTPTGCVEYSTPQCWVRSPGGWFNVPKVIEAVLHQGKCALTDRQISLNTKPVEEIESFEEFMELFKKHFRHAVRLHVIWSNLIDNVHAKVMPQPSVSILTDDCIKKGKDVSQGGARYNFTSPLMVGIATAVDSLSIIKKKVFEERTFSLRELVEALDSNFKGAEVLRARLLNYPYRYGNDYDEVDDMAREISVLFCDEFAKYRISRENGKFRAGFWSVTANFNLGLGTAASADGRKAKEELSDSITPNSGKDVNGLTASLKSAAKLDQRRASCGTVLNRHITPTELQGADKIRRFVDMVDTYFELGGTNLGFNVVSAETLKKAQQNPEDYSGLMVKVAGYAAFFVELGKPCQDALIARTEHGLS